MPHPRRSFSALATVALCAAGVAVSLSWYRADAAPAPAASSAVPQNPAGAVMLQQRFDKQVKPLFVKYCYGCHGNGKQRGDFSLERFNSLASIQSERGLWQHLSDVVRQDLMPPEERPQPTQAEADTLLAWVSDALAFCDCTGPRDPGRVAIHRLNRTEYNNTIRDLLGVADFRPADDFPADDTGYGFDNIADVLTMSPLLAEKYLAAAEQVMDKALPSEDPRAAKVKKYTDDKLVANGDGNSGGELGRNGEAAVEHEFPADAAYEIRIRAAQDKFGDEPAKMTLRLDGKDLETFEVRNVRGAKPVVFKHKLDVKAGKRRVAAAYINNKVDNNNRDRRKRGDRNLHVDYIEIEALNAPPPEPTPTHKQIFFVKPGSGVGETEAARQVVRKFATRAFRRPATDEEVALLLKVYQFARADGGDFEQGVKLALTAVLVSPHFLFRVELDPQDAAARLAANPRAAYALGDYELASRLSYFLWSSMPDEQLMMLAQAGALRKPEVLETQVKRMLRDPKAAAFVQNFAGQWLELRNLDGYSPDSKKYPQFDDELREAMKRETELFFENVLKEDRSVLELLDADYTFLNERLAKHYGIKGVKGDSFRRVNLKGPTRSSQGDVPDPGEAGRRRGGVLSMASVLTVTAMPSRTSPVKRGKFVLEQILGAPPPPPPADVPPLADKPQDEQAASLKKRLEIHRDDPNCNVCHVRMDSIGFSMENFDAIGGWREKDGGFAIDATGQLPEGQVLDGPQSLRKVLVERKGEFVRCLTEKMLTYAMGRGLEYYDQCTVKDVVAEVERSNYRMSALVSAIVKTDAFQKRRISADAKPDATKSKPATPPATPAPAGK